MIIEDGKGTSRKAEVDIYNRLSVKNTGNISFHSSQDQDAYLFGTNGFISITSVDTETGIFYLKNTNEDKNFFIHSIRTCANQIHKVILYKNPTGGTLISGATAGSGVNLNFNSSNSPEALYYKGAEGATLTGGTAMGNHINNIGHSTDEFVDAFIIGSGDSVAVTISLAAAGDCCARIIGYYD